MKRTFFAAIMVFLILSPIGCGHHDSSSPIITSFIMSDPVYDGDIEEVSPGVYATPTQGYTQIVRAGIDPFFPNTEFRAFLDFPLTGSGGVPGNAIIDSATLDIEINNIVPQPLTGTIPIRIDLVSFQPPTLVGTDFDRNHQPALATMTISPPISQSDFGQHITLDVTSLMMEAQRLGLSDFQLRILEDPIDALGYIEINDTTGTNRGALAPFLSVSYF